MLHNRTDQHNIIVLYILILSEIMMPFHSSQYFPTSNSLVPSCQHDITSPEEYRSTLLLSVPRNRPAAWFSGNVVAF